MSAIPPDPLSAARAGRRLRWPPGLGRDFSASLVVALAALSFYISSASLLFQGGLAASLPTAIGAALMGGSLLSLYAAWRGALPLASVGAEPAMVPVLAAITAGIAASVSGPALVPTALMALTFTGLGIGGSWWLAGRRGWGDLIRYIPYPVIGGFLGSIGWLMLSGGFGVSMGQAFSLTQLAAWLGGAADARLAVGIALGLLIWQLTLRYPHPFTLPAVLVCAALAIHLGLALAGIDNAAARRAGWLLARFSHTTPVLPWSPDVLAAVRWEAIVRELPLMVSAVIVATIGLLLSVTSLEVAWDERADINQDLRALGQGNLAIVALGGLVGGISISRSMLNKAAGAVGRASGFFNGALCLLALAWGGPVIALVPRPLLGGMLVYLGLNMLKAWLIDSRRRLPLPDYLSLLAMVGVTAVAGFLPAVCIGVLACCFNFAVSSARLSPVRRLLSRREWPAKAERGAAQAELLLREGARLRIVELQGVLFFGSATRLLARIDALLGEADKPACLLLDFQHVHGLDTSAAQSLARLLKAARRAGVRVELSRLPAAVQQALKASAVLAAPAPRVHADIDAAVAAWDDEVLARCAAAAGEAEAPPSLEAALAGWLPPGTPAARLLAYFEPLLLAPGAWLFARGDASDALYLVRSGRLAIVVPANAESEGAAGGHELLLRTVHAGSAVGEMGLFRQTPRSASARAESAVALWRLSRQSFELMSHEQPEVAAALYRIFVMQMAGRIDQLSMQAHALAR